jgi:hypothetical protein
MTNAPITVQHCARSKVNTLHVVLFPRLFYSTIAYGTPAECLLVAVIELPATWPRDVTYRVTLTVHIRHLSACQVTTSRGKATNLYSIRSRHTLVIPLTLCNILRLSAGNRQVADICTSAAFTRRGNIHK